MKVEWPSWAPVPNKPTVSADVKQHSTKTALKLCEQAHGAGLSYPDALSCY